MSIPNDFIPASSFDAVPSDINDPDAVTDFRPTRGDLETLAYGYLERHYNILDFCAYGGIGSSEIEEIRYTRWRFETIAAVLSSDLIEKLQEYMKMREAQHSTLVAEVEAESAALIES